MKEFLIKKSNLNSSKKNELTEDDDSKNISLLIDTINNLVNVINVRVNLNSDEIKCIEDIINNINEI